jgi:hypothetical protein
MLDWQILKDSQYLPNYDRNRDGCWFPDWHYQELLLPHFHTGRVLVDEYSRTEFSGEELERLEANLRWALDRYEAKVDAWQVTTEAVTTAASKVEDHNRSSSRVIFQRDIIVDLLEKTLALIQRARAEDACLVFFGD